MIKIISFLIFLISFYSNAQNDSILKGKVTSESSNLEGIHVINRSTETGVVTTDGGYFTIKAKASDTIVFSAVHLKAVVYFVKEEDFNENLLFVNMESMISELNEVVLTEYKNINAVALGIVPANQKRYTSAERKLYTAKGGGNRYGLSTSVSLDGILNGISGRTKMLKKELEIESKEMLQEKISDYFQRDYLKNTLKIPEDYIDGFVFYIVEDRRFKESMKNENKTMATFILGQLASQYLKLKNLEIDDATKTEK
jgi:hypothetical protein